MAYRIVNNLDESQSRDVERIELTAFVDKLLNRIGTQEGGTWVNIEVSNIDQGSRVENYSIIQRREDS